MLSRFCCIPLVLHYIPDRMRIYYLTVPVWRTKWHCIILLSWRGCASAAVCGSDSDYHNRDLQIPISRIPALSLPCPFKIKYLVSLRD